MTPSGDWTVQHNTQDTDRRPGRALPSRRPDFLLYRRSPALTAMSVCPSSPNDDRLPTRSAHRVQIRVAGSAPADAILQSSACNTRATFERQPALMPDLALSHLPPIIVPKRSPSGPGLVHQPLTRDSHAAGNRGRAVASLRAAVRLVRATCAREWHPQIAASELGPAKRGHHFPNRDDPHESRPRRLYMVVDDAISPVVLEVTTIDRPPRVEAVSVTEGLDETDVLSEAFERQAPILLAAARALLRNEADARDLVQTTLEIASRKAGDLRDPAALRAWLLAIQVREAFRLRRRLAHLVRLSPDIVEISPSPGPETDVIALRAALAKLPPRSRAAVVLHYLADLSVANVARTMGISENTTKGHLKAGLVRLREELRDD